MRSLEQVPAEVLAALAGWQAVDLLPCVLADIPDPKVIRFAVERESPGIAHAKHPDFRAVSGHADERVARRNAVRSHRDGLGSAGLAHVEPKDLAEQHVRVLCAILRVPARTAVTHSDVQIVVGTEDDAPAVVVRIRLPHQQDPLPRSRSSRCRSAGPRPCISRRSCRPTRRCSSRRNDRCRCTPARTPSRATPARHRN